MTCSDRCKRVLVGTFVIGCIAASAWADEPTQSKGNWFNLLSAQTRAVSASAAATEDPAPAGWEKPIPVSFSIDYTFASDYIFRGINFSEYNKKLGFTENEGSERGNHQLTVGTEVDLGDFGRVGGSVWFEWFTAQSYLTPNDGDDTLQEVDYTVYYGYTLASIGTDVEVGYIWYEFPRLRHDSWIDSDSASTQEIYVKVSVNDGPLWKALGIGDGEEAVLNPYVLSAWDMDLAPSGYYGEFGISHDFAVAALGCDRTPLLKDLTVTPSWVIAWSNNWLNKYTLDPSASAGNEGRGYASSRSGLQNIVYGLDVSYDLKSALNLPDQYCGDLYVKGFLRYSQAIADHFLDDEFYGGVSVGYGW